MATNHYIAAGANTNFEVNTTGWSSAATLTRIPNPVPKFGDWCLQLSHTNSNTWTLAGPNMPCIPSTQYTASIWVFIPTINASGDSAQIRLVGDSSGSTSGTSTTVTNTWVQLSVTKTMSASDVIALINIQDSAPTTNNTMYFSAAQIERGSQASSFYTRVLPNRPSNIGKSLQAGSGVSTAGGMN